MSEIPIEHIGVGTMIEVTDGSYFGSPCKAAGQLQSIDVQLDAVHFRLKLTGTTNEELLKHQTGSPSQLVRVHRCPSDCTADRMGEDLLHAFKMRKLGLAHPEEGWARNLVVVAADDELGALRSRGEALAPVDPGREGVVEKKDDKAKKAERSPSKRRKKDKKKSKRSKKKKKESGRSVSTEGRGRKKAKEEEAKKRRRSSTSSSRSVQLTGKYPRAASTKSYDALYSGTGLDKKERIRRRVLKKAKRAARKKTKEKSSDGSDSSSDQSGSDLEAEAEDTLFEGETKVQRIAQRCPGALAYQALAMMRSNLLQEAGAPREGLLGAYCTHVYAAAPRQEGQWSSTSRNPHIVDSSGPVAEFSTGESARHTAAEIEVSGSRPERRPLVSGAEVGSRADRELDAYSPRGVELSTKRGLYRCSNKDVGRPVRRPTKRLCKRKLQEQRRRQARQRSSKREGQRKGQEQVVQQGGAGEQIEAPGNGRPEIDYEAALNFGWVSGARDRPGEAEIALGGPFGQLTHTPQAVVDQPVDEAPLLEADGCNTFPPMPPPFVCEVGTAKASDLVMSDAKKERLGSELEGRSIGELGGWVVQRFLEVVPLRSMFTGKGGNRDIFPLPTSFDFLGSLWPSRCRNQIDWMVCMTTALNSFWGEELFGKDEASEIQIKVLNNLLEEVERFCNMGLVTVGIDWGSFFAVKSIDYKGDEVKVARWISWDNIEPALPKEIGAVALEEVCSLGCKEYVTSFDQYLKPKHLWGKVSRPRVMVDDQEWGRMCQGLVKAGVCCFLESGEVFDTGSGPLLNGLFGVSKDEHTSSGTEICRLIMNLTPLNALCQPLGGDVDTLPSWGMMSPFFLQPGENLLVSSKDVKCFFYTMRLPQCWVRFLAFNKEVPAEVLPEDLKSKTVYLASRVLPMGFLNSVSLAQNVHRNLVQWATHEGEVVNLGHQELRKDRPFPSALTSCRVYLDNYDLLERVDATGMVEKEGTVPAGILALRSEYERWDVPRNTKKSVERSARCELQGATVDGVRGLAFPKEAKLSKYMSMGMKLVEQRYVTQRQMQVVWWPGLLFDVQTADVGPAERGVAFHRVIQREAAEVPAAAQGVSF